MLEIATAGKPDCYKPGGAVIAFDSGRKAVAARLAGGGVLEIATASKPDCYKTGGAVIAFDSGRKAVAAWLAGGGASETAIVGKSASNAFGRITAKAKGMRR